MATISMDLRQRILKAYDRGDATRERVASRFDVSLGMVKKPIQQRRACGGISSRALPGLQPDRNDVEQSQAPLRKAEARNGETLLHAIGGALDKITEKDATHWFARCGYKFI